jgi:cyanophycinase
MKHPAPLVIVLFSVVFTLAGCRPSHETSSQATECFSKGQLFIIGGGKRSEKLIIDMVRLSGADSVDPVIILPWASEEPDSAAAGIYNQLQRQGLRNISIIHADSGEVLSKEYIEAINKARLIYITGGSQEKFMNLVRGTPVFEALTVCYRNGGMIAGTSAGAAVMSKRMITGNELKKSQYTGDFRTIEQGNYELADGMDFLGGAIIDQHFVYRMRMNRLLAVVLENPEYTGIGIDESTALHVKDCQGVVYGEAQVITFQADSASIKRNGDLLGASRVLTGIYLPGDTLPMVIR